jgi:signal transduction histidine kinase/CheY-like chemotaxis protein
MLSRTPSPAAEDGQPSPDAGIARRGSRGMRLSTRLLLLILLCMLPLLAVAIYTQIDLQTQRQPQLSELAMRQAELINGDVASILGGARQFAHAVTDFDGVQRLSGDCGARMSRLAEGLPEYKFVAVFDTNGKIVCSSSPALVAATTASPPDWVSQLLAAHEFNVGRYATQPGIDGPFLPLAMPIFPLQADHPAAPRDPALSGERPVGQFIMALDLGWLARHIEELTLTHSRFLANSGLIIADRDGAILGRFPNPDQDLGQHVSQEVNALFMQGKPGVATVQGGDGKRRLAAYIPDIVPPAGVSEMVTLYTPDLTADIDRATTREIILIAVSAVLALTLTLLAGRRFVFRPTQRLIAAARRWQAGDLSARADIDERRSEFGTLALAFNAMASALQARDLERRLEAELLEAQVLERTRELSDSNNRLQVEIAEREKTEAALHQAHKLQAVGQLAGGIAHDFNNMLATILGNLELIERRLPPGSSVEQERLLTLIERATGAVQRGAQLTSRLLAFSRRQRLAAKTTDLNRLVADLVTLASSTLGRRVQVTTELASELWPCMVDPSQIEAAILNLCLNARDAMPDGGQISIITTNHSVATTSDELDAGDYVWVRIIDTGTGMTPDVQRRAFEPFFTTKGPGGSGLGLSQVYGLVRQSGGAVRIKTAPGEGTEVSLLLPRAAVASDAEPATRRIEPADRLPPSTAMVVDDDPAVRQVTADMLRDLGCQVLEASGGEEALTVMGSAATPVNLVLLDYAMPGMNGIQLAQKIRERGILAPIVLATGYAELADPPEDGAGLLDGLLRKPFTIRELQAILGRVRPRPFPGSNVVPLRTPRRG